MAVAEALVRLDADAVDPHLKLAAELGELEGYEQAEALLHGVLGEHPQHPGASNALAMLFRRRGMNERAAELFLELADRHRDWAALRFEACVDLQAMGRFEELLPHLDEFLGQQPRHLGARLRRAEVLRELRQYEKSIEQYRQLLDETDRDIPVLIGMALSLEAVGRFDESLHWARRACSIQPDHMDAIFLAARILERIGDIGALLEFWREASGSLPGNVALQIRYAETLSDAGLYEDAQGQWQSCRARFNDSIEVLVGAGLFARRIGRRAEAAAALLEAHALAPGRPRLAFECARDLAQLGRTDEAARYLALETSGDSDILELRTSLERLTGAAAAPGLHQAVAGEQPASLLFEMMEGADPSWERCLAAANAHFEYGDFRTCRALLRQVFERVLKTGIGSRSQFKALMYDMHRYGQADFHAALLAHFQVACPQLIDHEMVVEQLAESGEVDRAEALIATVSTRIGRGNTFRLGLRVMKERQDYAAADAMMAKNIGVDRLVSLADLKDWVRILIDSERIGEARRLLLRHEQVFANGALVDERAELLQLDLRCDDQLLMLQHEVRRDLYNERSALKLTRALAVRGLGAEAQNLLQAWEGRAVHRLAWLIERIVVAFHGARDWDELFDAHAYGLRHGTPADRFALWLLSIDHMMLRGWHDRADREVDAFGVALASRLMSDADRGWHLLTTANLLLRLRRHAEAAAILEGLESRRLGVMHDALHRQCAANAAYQQQGELFLHHNHQLRRPRDRVTLTPFASRSEGELPRLRAAVLVHLFYPELWPELLLHLQSLKGTDFRLFVSIREIHAGSNIDAMIREHFPDAEIHVAANRGFDVGAHWQTLRRVDLSRFDVVLLLHAKKSAHARTGDAWRNTLLASLIGTPEKWRENLHEFSADPRLGQIGSAFHRNTSDLLLCEEMRRTLELLEMPTEFDALKHYYEFVGGTMLMMRAELLAEIHGKTADRIEFETYESLTLARKRDATYAHALERALGLYVGWRGYRSIWRA